MRLIVLLATLAAFAVPALAQADLEAPVEVSQEEIDAYLATVTESLTWRQGDVTLEGGVATVRVPDTYRFLGPDDAETVLTTWGNPPGVGALGMLFPAGVDPFDETAWGVIVTFQEDGYVSDEDAADIDYDQLLADMKEGTEAENEARVEQGYESIHLVGWAEPPHYDPATKKLFWAKDLRFEGSPESTLNYDVRMLGRRGVLSFNAVASTGQLAEVRDGMAEVMAFSDFNEGHRYQDFDPDVDKVAAYGIGALIVGKVAAKAGFFKVLLLFLAKGWKIGLVALAALGAVLKRVLGKDDPGPQATA